MFGKTLENLLQDAREIKNYAFGCKSKQVVFQSISPNITKDSQVNEKENDVEEESRVESVGWRSLSIGENQTRQYENTD